MKALLEKLPCPLAIVRGDGSVEYLNPRMIEMLGYGTDEITTMRRWFDLILADNNTLDSVTSQWQGDTITAKQGSVEPRTIRVVCKDGSRLTVLCDLVFMDNDNFLYAMRDVSAQVQSEHTLQETLKRYRSVSELIADYAYSASLDEEGNSKIEWFLGAIEQITGYTAE